MPGTLFKMAYTIFNLPDLNPSSLPVTVIVCCSSTQGCHTSRHFLLISARLLLSFIILLLYWLATLFFGCARPEEDIFSGNTSYDPRYNETAVAYTLLKGWNTLMQPTPPNDNLGFGRRWLNLTSPGDVGIGSGVGFGLQDVIVAFYPLDSLPQWKNCEPWPPGWLPDPYDYPLGGDPCSIPDAEPILTGNLQLWLESENILVTIPKYSNDGAACPLQPFRHPYTKGDWCRPCPLRPCSNYTACQTFYHCFFGTLESFEVSYPNQSYKDIATSFSNCMGDRHLLQCHLRFLDLSSDTDNTASHIACRADQYKPTVQNWIDASTDYSIQVFIDSGLGSDGIYWTGRNPSLQFSQDIGRRYTNIDNYDRSLKAPCRHDLVCSEIGSRSVVQRGRQVLRSRPAYFTTVALENINQHLTTQFDAFTAATNQLALDTFSIGDFFPKSDQDFSILNGSTVLGTILSVVGGFVPVVGPGISATGSILPAVGSFLGNAVAAKTDPLVGPKTFASRVKVIYEELLVALESMTTTLFTG